MHQHQILVSSDYEGGAHPSKEELEMICEDSESWYRMSAYLVH